MRKPGSKVRLTMRSPCTSRMREEQSRPSAPARTRAGSAPALRREQQRLADRLDGQRDDDLVGDLVVWPSPLPPTSVMFLPIRSNSGFMRLERALRRRRP